MFGPYLVLLMDVLCELEAELSGRPKANEVDVTNLALYLRNISVGLLFLGSSD